MNPDHVSKLLNRSRLSEVEKAALAPRKISNALHTQTNHGYDSANDAEFESLDDRYAALCAAHPYGGSDFSPLSDLSQTPTGKLWLICFTIRLLGGNANTANDDARSLMPVVANTRSAVVRLKVSCALRSILRNFPETLSPDLTEVVSKALAACGVIQ
ncbi:hypothetical protein HDF16_001595 [Granulicella aggregans]|uniref:Uncharacterized protein n=1 Tax=Granulicella aggregans TaxID=474949 RepID=A0A7W7ZBM3_9BACT|nr:hypothetical protein [Granulicella aggregans]MBB5056910.1 hypothetical protein [Granulicella aggregans]